MFNDEEEDRIVSIICNTLELRAERDGNILTLTLVAAGAGPTISDRDRTISKVEVELPDNGRYIGLDRV